MALIKLPKWDSGFFHDFLMATAHLPFKWGSNDCCLFCANGILAMTGTDVAADFRNKYTDKVSAFRAIKKITGGSTVVDAAAYCATKAEMQEREYPLSAQRGDLVLIDYDGELIAGLVHLNGRDAISVGEAGLVRVPLTSVKRVWNV